MILMNKDREVLFFDDEDKTIKILNNEMLPYQLIDDLKDSEDIQTIGEGIRNYDKLRSFFADRVLSLSRDNAKQILESIQYTQKLTEEQSFQLSLKCRGVHVNDSYWVKRDDEAVRFDEVNIRNISLHEIVFQVSMKGTPISIQHELDADIVTKGMFRKTWVREQDGLYLLKSDRTSNYINTKCEIAASNLLDEANYPHVKYEAVTVDGVFCCKCKCFSDDSTSFIDAEYVKRYCDNHGMDFLEFVKDNYASEFADMAVIDYCLGNPDRHWNNFGFLVDTETNKIKSFGPIFDNNQALIIFETRKEKEFDGLIYPATNEPILETAIRWFPFSTIRLDHVSNENVRGRFRHLEKMVLPMQPA